MKQLLLVVVLIVVVGLVTITCGGGGGGGAGPTAPTAPTEVSIAGEWTGEKRVTSFSGGGCYGAELAAHLAEHPTVFDWAYTETITQTGSVISASRTMRYWLDYPEIVCEEPCDSCESSGSISGSTYTLTDDSCIGDEMEAPSCSPEELGIQRLVAASQTGTVSGNTISGTGEETVNVFEANGDPAGVLTVRYSFTQNRG